MKQVAFILVLLMAALLVGAGCVDVNKHVTLDMAVNDSTTVRYAHANMPFAPKETIITISSPGMYKLHVTTNSPNDAVTVGWGPDTVNWSETDKFGNTEYTVRYHETFGRTQSCVITKFSDCDTTINYENPTNIASNAVATGMPIWVRDTGSGNIIVTRVS